MNFDLDYFMYACGMPSVNFRIKYEPETPPMTNNPRCGAAFTLASRDLNPDRVGSGLGYEDDEGDDSDNLDSGSDGYDDDDNDDDDDEDETFIYLYPSPESRRLNPDSQLAGHISTIVDAAITRFTQVSDAAHAETEAIQRFACPFYLHSPSKHRACIRDDLKRIIDVKRHLWARHRRPYDCPVCGATFDAPAACDNHIRRGGCAQTESQNQSTAHLESISDDQLHLLAQPSSPGRSDDKQWEHIWKLVFPRSKIPAQMARQDAFLLQALAVRKFWRDEGVDVITQALGTLGEPQNLRKRDRGALWDIVLDAMIDKMVAGDLRG